MNSPIGDTSEGFFRALFGTGLSWFAGKSTDKRRKQRLVQMLSDPRFPRGFRSIEQLMAGIAADKEKTEALLLEIKARKSEVPPEEWTLKPYNPS